MRLWSIAIEDIKPGNSQSTQFRGVRRASNMLVYIGSGILAVMMFLTAADVIGRMFRHPIEGTYELVGLLLVLVLGMGVANAQMQKAYVSVSIIYDRFPPKVRTALDIVSYIAATAIAVLLCWQVSVLGWRYIIVSRESLPRLCLYLRPVSHRISPRLRFYDTGMFTRYFFRSQKETG